MSSSAVVWARRFGRATLIACTSVTLAACYGAPADAGYDSWEDSVGDGFLDVGSGGNVGSGGASSCAATARIDVDEPPESSLLKLSPTSVFDRGSCSFGAGRGVGLRFHAHETGVHRFSVDAVFPVALTVFTVEGEGCSQSLGCESASPMGGAGGEGGDGAAVASAAVAVEMNEGDIVALFMSGDTEQREPLPEVVLRIETP